MDALILCGIVSLCGRGKKTIEKEKQFSEHHFSFLLSSVAEGLFSQSPPPSSSSLFTPSDPASWTLHMTFAKTIWKAWGSSRRENDCVVRSLEWRDCNSHRVCVCVCASPCWDWSLTTVLTWGLRCEWSGSGGSDSPHWASYILQWGHHH